MANLNLNADVTNGSATEKRLFDAKMQVFKIEAKQEWHKSEECLALKKPFKTTMVIAVCISVIAFGYGLIRNLTAPINEYSGWHLNNLDCFVFFFLPPILLAGIVLLIIYFVKRKSFIKARIASKTVEFLEDK